MPQFWHSALTNSIQRPAFIVQNWRVPALGACVASVLLRAAAAPADWVRVDTPNFIVYGDAGERRVRDVADEFERFREALARVIPATATPPAVPTVVVV